MAEQLVRFNENGLALSPPKLDCLPEIEHQRLMGEQKCFIDEHHLYFTRAKFDNHPVGLVKEFAQHPFNRVPMPRCQHNLLHSKYTGAAIPRLDVIDRFLEEATTLTKLGVTVKALVDIETALKSDDPKITARNPTRYFERHEEFCEIHDILMQQVLLSEVMPRRVALGGLRRILPGAIKYNPFENQVTVPSSL